jgi:hypothetical protein
MPAQGSAMPRLKPLRPRSARIRLLHRPHLSSKRRRQGLERLLVEALVQARLLRQLQQR